jgi:hypothetical protein
MPCSYLHKYRSLTVNLNSKNNNIAHHLNTTPNPGTTPRRSFGQRKVEAFFITFVNSITYETVAHARSSNRCR